jgi:uncharacterized protein (TIGR03067 family)
MIPTLATLFSLACACGLSLAPDPPPRADSDKTEEKIQGTWLLDRVETDGKQVQDPKYEGATATFDKGKVRTVDKDETKEGEYKIDASSNPKSIDLVYKPKKGGEYLFRGIYRLEGDVLTLCLVGPEGERQKEFVTKPGQGQYLQVWKRKGAGGK